MDTKQIKVSCSEDVIKARQIGRNMAREIGFGSADQTRLATAISELTRNIINYAGEGVFEISDISDGIKNGLHVVVEDNGPGIPNIENAMKDGFTTGNGLGAGLPGTKRLVTFFDLK
ncbi:MAG: anti-sigma regulatory factor [Draconibacterium sp.]|nr:anti-sigma regulatory factor [Draconibacterium sp.]